MKISAFEIQEWEREAFDRLAEEHGVRFEPVPPDAANRTARGDTTSRDIGAGADGAPENVVPS